MSFLQNGSWIQTLLGKTTGSIASSSRGMSCLVVSLLVMLVAVDQFLNQLFKDYKVNISIYLGKNNKHSKRFLILHFFSFINGNAFIKREFTLTGYQVLTVDAEKAR